MNLFSRIPVPKLLLQYLQRTDALQLCHTCLPLRHDYLMHMIVTYEWDLPMGFSENDSYFANQITHLTIDEISASSMRDLSQHFPKWTFLRIKRNESNKSYYQGCTWELCPSDLPRTITTLAVDVRITFSHGIWPCGLTTIDINHKLISVHNVQWPPTLTSLKLTNPDLWIEIPTTVLHLTINGYGLEYFVLNELTKTIPPSVTSLAIKAWEQPDLQHLTHLSHLTLCTMFVEPSKFPAQNLQLDLTRARRSIRLNNVKSDGRIAQRGPT